MLGRHMQSHQTVLLAVASVDARLTCLENDPQRAIKCGSSETMWENLFIGMSHVTLNADAGHDTESVV